MSGCEEGELIEESSSHTIPKNPDFATPSPRAVTTPGANSGRTNPLARRKWYGCCPLNDFELLEKVGEGTFGEVHKARHKKSGKMVALKKILCRAEQEGVPRNLAGSGKRFPITALREIKLLKALRHPNVIELIDMAASPEEGAVFMVFPYMEHDLTGLLENEAIRFSVPQIKCYMKQLLEGIKYLHKCRVLHRDIKGSNILLNNRGELRVTDFGLARPLEENRRHYTPGVVTRWYRPPELLFGATEYNELIDMWGSGCILAEMYIKRPLLPGDSDLNQLELISRLCGTPTETTMPGVSALPNFEKISLPSCKRRIPDGFPSIDPLGVDLIDKLLVLDPNKRLTAEQALDHAYFRTSPLAALPQSLPTYPSAHEYDCQKRKEQQALVRPHPTPHEHGIHRSSSPKLLPPSPESWRRDRGRERERKIFDHTELYRRDDPSEQRRYHRSRDRQRSFDRYDGDYDRSKSYRERHGLEHRYYDRGQSRERGDRGAEVSERRSYETSYDRRTGRHRANLSERYGDSYVAKRSHEYFEGKDDRRARGPRSRSRSISRHR